MDSAILIDNLEPLVFLTLTGKEAKMNDPLSLKIRLGGITYLKFNCAMISRP